MKKSNSFYYFVGLLIVTTLSAYAFLNRVYLAPFKQDENITIELQWAVYDSSHVAIEYNVNGVIKTPLGNYTDCPVGQSIVKDSSGKDITGKIFTSCRFVSDGQYYVTQIFYNDFKKDIPQKVDIIIGNKVFVSNDGQQEIYIPALQTISLNLAGYGFEDNNPIFLDKTAKTESGLEMSINRADFTPRLAKIDACVTLPDNGDWGIDAYVNMAGNEFAIDYWEIPNFRELKSGEITFEIKKIYKNMPDCIDATGFEKIKDELEAYKIYLKPDPGGYYCFTGAIMDLGDAEANAYLFNYIREALKEEVEGPLTITIK